MVAPPPLLLTWHESKNPWFLYALPTREGEGEGGKQGANHVRRCPQHSTLIPGAYQIIGGANSNMEKFPWLVIARETSSSGGQNSQTELEIRLTDGPSQRPWCVGVTPALRHEGGLTEPSCEACR